MSTHSMTFGYARVSTRDQSEQLQIDALQAAGCDKIFAESVSSSARNRPELARMRGELRAGDKVVVWRLDRLGRSLRDLIELVGEFEENEIGFVSLQESIDTSSSGGRLVFHLFASLAQFERELIRERTHAGLAVARSRGRTGGRPRALSPSQVSAAAQLLDVKGEDGQSVHTVKAVAEMMNVSRATLYRALGRAPQR